MTWPLVNPTFGYSTLSRFETESFFPSTTSSALVDILRSHTTSTNGHNVSRVLSSRPWRTDVPFVRNSGKEALGREHRLRFANAPDAMLPAFVAAEDVDLDA